MEISESEWGRMRLQRDLVFDKNAPSTVLQRQSAGKRGKNSDPRTPDRVVETRQARGALSSPEKRDTPEKTKPSSAGGSSGGGWFKKKKKKNESGDVLGAKQKSASLPRSLTGSVSSGGPSKPGRGGPVMKVTSIDDVEETDSGAESDGIKKTFSYEGALLPGSHDGHVTSVITRSTSHNAMFRATIIQAAQNHQHRRSPSHDATLDAPTISHSRSKSSEGGEEGVCERGGGEVCEGGGGEGVEARETSRSQTDISRMLVGGKEEEEEEGEREGVQIEPNLRLKKSGVVKETSARVQRPTLEVYTVYYNITQ